ncbi:MAG: ABC transporter permease [Mariniblastus sp.]|nr:ABC transporter permease [Mariniblastus sp.]
MNRILKMAMKDLKLLLRDKMGAFFIIGFPILMGLFFGLIMGNMGSTGGGGSQMRICIVDQDNSSLSQKFIESFQQNESVELKEMADLETARESVRKGQRVAMLVLTEGFGETAGVFWGEAPTIQIGADPSRAAESAMLQGFVMEAIGSLAGSRFQDQDLMNDFLEKSRQDLEDNESISVANRLLMKTFLGSVEGMVESIDALQTESDESSAAPGGEEGFQFANIEAIDVTRTIDPKSQRGQVMKMKSRWDVSFPQAMMWGVLACCAGFAISIAQERTQGTLTRLQVAPVSKFEIIGGKALACFISVIAVIALMTVLGIQLGMRPKNFPLLILAAVCVSFCFVGIMMVMSVLGKTEQSVNGAGWAINMVMAMLGGCMIPVMFMPQFMQSLSVVSPIRWAILSIEGAIWRDFSFTEMLLPCGILLAIGASGVAVGVQVLKRTT